MKKFLAIILVVGIVSTYTVAFASDIQSIKISESISNSDDINNYEQVPVLTISSNTYSTLRFKEVAQMNVKKAREAVLELDLSSQGLTYIEEACLTELDALALDPDCLLNEYTVLIPKARSSTPSYFATYYGRDYYTLLTSMSNITLMKNSSFGTYNNIKRWSQNAISLGLCFSNVLEVTIPWALITASLPSKYTVYTTDWMDAYINLNPTNRAVYVKDSTKYVNVVNREFGQVRPYFVYHYNDATSPSPTKTIYSNYTTYPDASSGTTRDSLLYVARATYDSGANPVSFNLRTIVDLLWK